MPRQEREDDRFQVSGWVDKFGGFINRNQNLWIKLGNRETRLLADTLADVQVRRPIYVTGLARSGSTILLEMLSECEGTVTHRYKDYPPVFTPYFWNWFLNRMPKSDAKPAERTHRDGIMVTPESPEAFEEVLWMAFFPDAHDITHSNVFDQSIANPAFETFYRDHIRKLLAIRDGHRYLSKGNYNITRLEYLLKIFPDARFVIPIREPSWHIASLMKQHKLLSDGERRNPSALEHMRRVGHFEFGLDRRAINAGDRDCVQQVTALWEQGRDVEGWARYWVHIYGFVADRLEHNPRLKSAVLLIRFEDLCQEPQTAIRALFDHCDVAGDDALVARWAEKIHAPSYYKPDFSDEEFDMIDRLTQPVANRFGYAEPRLRRFRGWLT
ncbi:MAG: sulfotransferase [Gammaproteobacteria bacterium]|nr:sulfotransferase [Gammaproteobacteria bacterium]